MIAKYLEGESGYKEDEDIVGGLAFTVYSGTAYISPRRLDHLVGIKGPHFNSRCI